MQLPEVPAGSDGSAVLGVGIDVVAVARFAAAMSRTPGLLNRLFVDDELRTPSGNRRGHSSLAARFAAKEAVAKALGVPPGMDWHHCIVRAEGSGRPYLEMVDSVAQAAAVQGIRQWRLSLSHDAGIAAAVVLALS